MAKNVKGPQTTIKQGTATKPSDYYGKSHGVAKLPEGPSPFAVNGTGGLSGKDAKGLSTLTHSKK